MRNAGHGFIGVVLFCALLVMGLATANSPAAIRTMGSLQCTEITSGDIILMRARFEENIGVTTFGITFEAEPDFGVDRELTVVVAGVPVGAFTSQPIVGGYVGGEMTLSDLVVPFTQTDPFPLEFPSVVARNTKVSLIAGGKTLVSCRLE